MCLCDLFSYILETVKWIVQISHGTHELPPNKLSLEKLGHEKEISKLADSLQKVVFGKNGQNGQNGQVSCSCPI